jgi:hypothetical protein
LIQGNFFGGAFFGGGFFGPLPTATIGSKGHARKKKIRGPYSDPRIFEAYVQRCIAERAAPRVDPAKAAVQEALIHEVEQRRAQDIVTLDALVSENEALRAVIDVERSKLGLRALRARQEQIGRQVQAMKKEWETVNLLHAMFEFLDED